MHRFFTGGKKSLFPLSCIHRKLSDRLDVIEGLFFLFIAAHTELEGLVKREGAAAMIIGKW